MRNSPALPLLALLAACAPKPAEPPAAPDPIAIKASMDSLRAEYGRLNNAADAAGLAAMYTEDGAIDLYGAPKMRGRAGIEAGLKTGFAAQKPVMLEIVALQTNPVSPAIVGELGTYHAMDSVASKVMHSWGRWITSASKDSSGAWKLKYLMAFPDSQKTDK